MSSTSRSKPNRVEQIKAESQFLAGTIRDDLSSDAATFGKDNLQLLKFHGTYQQDDRDARVSLRQQGKDKAFSMMVRCRIPGGRLTSRQFLAHLDLCDLLGNSTMKITTRQTIQLHGIVKQDLRQTIATINSLGLSTFAACGDVNRNVMCCPAKKNSPVHQAIEQLTKDLAEELAPRTTTYRELWVLDDKTGERHLVEEHSATREMSDTTEPLYGPTYLPRKFKCAVISPDDNCVDVYTQDLGFIAIVQQNEVVGYNVVVGGGMGTTPSNSATFPALAQPMAFCLPKQAIDVAKAVLIVQRDHGNRSDRKVARMKYLIANWGLPKFRAAVEDVLGYSLESPREVVIRQTDDHMGWQSQEDGLWSYGLNIENGRVSDGKTVHLKNALRQLAEFHQEEIRLSANQSLIFCNIPADKREQFDSILKGSQVRSTEETSLVRRHSLACVALPTCGLAVTEAERRLPFVMDQLEAVLQSLELDRSQFTVRMTGCPNGCARPYAADVALVGKAVDRYTLFVGGTLRGDRLAFLLKDMVTSEDIVAELTSLFIAFRNHRLNDETLGDFCHRLGGESLLSLCHQSRESEDFTTALSAKGSL
ncbi:NADPH-dependent assimilatory sulfite reductase hemoprotein subunit [Bremerella sp. JC817]|uniref:NADPH-dependent assimilatory sulfite reductase hemoprotein subunit n=1 Tax=Bremerella sp. JC817 TaxID=3231756 RepID=UPI003458C7AE